MTGELGNAHIKMMSIIDDIDEAFGQQTEMQATWGVLAPKLRAAISLARAVAVMMKDIEAIFGDDNGIESTLELAKNWPIIPSKDRILGHMDHVNKLIGHCSAGRPVPRDDFYLAADAFWAAVHIVAGNMGDVAHFEALLEHRLANPGVDRSEQERLFPNPSE